MIFYTDYISLHFYQKYLKLFQPKCRITFPVVNDGLPARIRACEARPGLANCGVVRRGSERSDRPSRTEPEPPKAAMRLQSCYVQVLRVLYFFFP